MVTLVAECQRTREGTFEIDFRRMHFVGLGNFDFLTLQKGFHAQALFDFEFCFIPAHFGVDTIVLILIQF